MKEVGTRDRWVMAGLVTLGLFTVFAGVLSGRSTINYVLSRDAREAALTWTGEIDESLRNSTEVTAPRDAGDTIEVLNAAALEAAVAGAGDQNIALPTGPSFRDDGFKLIDGFDRLTRGWFLSSLDEKKDDFVSRMDGFAVLSPNGRTLAVGGDLSADAISVILKQGDIKQALADVTRDDTIEVADLSGEGQNDLRMAFVPVMQEGEISRV